VFYCFENEEEHFTFDELRKVLFSCCGSDSEDLDFVLGEKWLRMADLT
jgi:hypothetical protein